MILAAAESRFVHTLATHLQLSETEVLDGLLGAHTVLEAGRMIALSLTAFSTALPAQVSFEGLDALLELEVTGCGLSHLDLAGMPRLQTLKASDNALTHIDLSLTPDLRQVNLAGNDLMVLDLSANPALRECDGSGNALTALIVPAHSDLVDLRASRNQLMVLDLPESPMLTTVACAHNALVRLSIRAPALRELDVRGNDLQELDPSTWPQLDVLRVDQNRLAHLELQNTPGLTTLSACGNYLDDMNFEGLEQLRRVDVSRNQLRHLSIQQRQLEVLNCAQNRLTQLELHAPKMRTLNAACNGLQALDLSRLTGLCSVDLQNNVMQRVTARLPSLARLNLESNPLTHLDIEGSPRLSQLDFDGDPEVRATLAQQRQVPRLQGPLPERLETMNRFQAHTYAARLTGSDRETALLPLVLDPERCARGTAVMIYWMTSPAFYVQFENRESVPAFALAGWDLLRAIEAQLRHAAYLHDDVFFDPQNDQQTVDPTGKNWTDALPSAPPELCARQGERSLGLSRGPLPPSSTE